MKNRVILFSTIIILLTFLLAMTTRAHTSLRTVTSHNSGYISMFLAGNYVQANFDKENISTHPAYQISVAVGYSHIYWGIRPELEFAYLTNTGLNEDDKKALTISYAMFNLIADIPMKKNPINTGSGTLPYIGLGIGTGTCNDNKEKNCKGTPTQVILGVRSNWDSFLSLILDLRYTKIYETQLVSLNFGLIQKF